MRAGIESRVDHEQAKQIGERFVRFVETNDPNGIFADDVFADINVPEWRFQMEGVEDVVAWLSGEQPDGASATLWRIDPLDSGVVVEVETRSGEKLSRNLHRLEVQDGRITGWTMYCTGDWDKETQERQAREAPMIRP